MTTQLCVYCDSDELVYHTTVSDFRCQTCGRWQDDPAFCDNRDCENVAVNRLHLPKLSPGYLLCTPCSSAFLLGQHSPEFQLAALAVDHQ